MRETKAMTNKIQIKRYQVTVAAKRKFQMRIDDDFDID